MYRTWNSKRPQLKCGSGNQIKAEFPQGVFDNQTCCFWFQCCSVSLALITQPITASGQSQALYDSSQPPTEEPVFCLHTHWVVGPIMFAVCTGYCCFAPLDVLKMLGNGSWILRGGVNAQWTYPMSPFGLNPFTIPIWDNVVSFKIFYLWCVCAWASVCVYIYINIYMVCYIWCSSFQKNITCKQEKHIAVFFPLGFILTESIE